MTKIEVSPAFSDGRGQITDLLQNECINAVTLITFTKGAVRGNHVHKQTTQWNFLISGCVKLLSQEAGHDVVETLMMPGDFAVTAPNVSHALVALVESVLMVFTSGPRGGKEYESDTIRLTNPLMSQDEEALKMRGE